MLKSNQGRIKLIEELNYVYEKEKTNVDGTKTYVEV